MVELNSTGCPKCNVLKKKLESKGVEFILIDNPEYVLLKANELNLLTVPFLIMEDGRVLTFEQAIKEF